MNFASYLNCVVAVPCTNVNNVGDVRHSWSIAWERPGDAILHGLVLIRE